MMWKVVVIGTMHVGKSGRIAHRVLSVRGTPLSTDIEQLLNRYFSEP